MLGTSEGSLIRRVFSYIDLGRGMCIFHLLVKSLGTECIRSKI
jgi:hypothetical protein